MAKKGGHKGFGTVYFRKDRGKYVAELEIGRDEEGHREVWRYYSDDENDARTALGRAVYERGRGVDLVPVAQTVEQYLSYWLKEVVKPAREYKTHESYEAIVRLHLIPAIGKLQLRNLTPQAVHQCLRGMAESGIGTRTQVLAHVTLHAALAQAVKWGIVNTNVVDRVDKPKGKKAERHAFSVDQGVQLLELTKADRYGPVYATALGLGLRQGEVLGLRWADVDFERGLIRTEYQLQIESGRHVLKAHKTARSRRTLPLPDFVADALRDQRARQILEESSHEWGLVFTTPRGAPVSGDWLTRVFRKRLRELGLPDLAFHELRHTTGSLLAAAGVPLTVVRDILGHSQLSTTDVYLHSAPNEHREAMDGLGRRLAGEGKRKGFDRD